MTLDARVKELVAQGLASSGPILFLTGAGISAESGIPTFRGEQGYWKVGSRNYQPEEMATRAAFAAMPDEVWGWYLFRRSTCRAAKPNPGHMAVAELERTLLNRFLLLTQNVDGLHLRAGNTRARTFEIHGNIDFMRCAVGCSAGLAPVPARFDEFERGRVLTSAERDELKCERCGAASRPHVLWFDECYDETLFRFESSLRAAQECALLVIVGTAGQTNLPRQVASLAGARGVPMIVVNEDESPFTRAAESVEHGYFVQGRSGEALPELVRLLSAPIP